MAGTKLAAGIHRLNLNKGFEALSLTNFTASTESQIASGSIVEVLGSYFSFSTDTSISGWDNITTGTTAYIGLVPSGTAGSQILTPIWLSSGTVINNALINRKQNTIFMGSFYKLIYNGEYSSTRIRVVGSVYKDGASSSSNKKLFFNDNSSKPRKQVFYSSGTWRCPFDCTQIIVTGCAAGTNGATGGAVPFGTGGAGGNGGSWVYKQAYSVTPNTEYSITIGGSGSNTTIAGVLTLTSGSILGGASGIPGNAGFECGGNSNDLGLYLGSPTSAGGGGGGSLGDGGSGGSGCYGESWGGPGAPGGYGAGGGGGGEGLVVGGAGGAGGPAIIIVEW